MQPTCPIPSESDLRNQFVLPLLEWFDHSGRKTLPWQLDRDPYKVWVSEIMLQQTQVTAVIPFFNRFITTFPSIQSLASSSADNVMHHWSGLGYYARARNLHKAAIQITTDHHGKFPVKIEQVIALPGIGRSTAGAILAFCLNLRHPILDGNVKRVLTRYFAISGYPGKRDVSNQLWQLADLLTPEQRVADYTQAIMDLGATVCTRSRPGCQHCPLASGCRGLALGSPTEFPTKKPKKDKPIKQVTMLILQNSKGEFLLEKRPQAGIWGGLWSFPELTADNDPSQVAENQFGLDLVEQTLLDTVHHGFTHFNLEIEPRLCRVEDLQNRIMDAAHYLWYNPERPQIIGLPAVISKMLKANN